MWARIASFIIRKRFYLLTGLLLATLFMGYHARNAQISHLFLQVMPKDDPIYQEHQNFKEIFGEDGNLFVIGFKGELFDHYTRYNEWHLLSRFAESFDGVEEVMSLGWLYNLERDREEQKLKLIRLPDSLPASGSELAILEEALFQLPFYEGLLYNTNRDVHLMAIRFDKPTLYSGKRIEIIEDIIEKAEIFAKRHDLEAHYSGMPYIRSILVTKVGSELQLFIYLAVLVTALVLLFFFRSVYWMIFPLLVIGILITFVLGTFGMFDMRITLLSALIPPLITVICVPNFIYFLNKYHIEFRKHGNKMRAITRVIQKIGAITFMTNFSTAVGFGVLALTQSPALQEFGFVASVNIVATYFVTLILIPVVFSLLPEPSVRQTNYLQGKAIGGVIRSIQNIVQYHRKWVYVTTFFIVTISIIGLTRLEAVGFIMDDIPRDDQAYRDLMFFEEHFDGVMPLEVVIDTRQERGLQNLSTLRKVRILQDSLESQPVVSRTISPADLLKFARQAYYNGAPARYDIPSSREQSFLQPYLTNMNADGKGGILTALVDDDQQIGRISAQIKDIGSVELTRFIEQMGKTASEIFADDDFRISFTGTSIVFVKGNDYLVWSLIQSISLAFLIIAILMGLLFQKVRMVFLSLIPTFLPLIITAGVMGFAGIPLKPSTLLVFSIAFGISIDDALHFLGKYRQEIKNFSGNVPETIAFTLKETGTSMIFTSLVLFCGFAIFYFSNFGGTQAIGLLTSMTLLVAMVTNLVLLPSLLYRSPD